MSNGGGYNQLDGIVMFPVEAKHGFKDNELHLRRQVRNLVKAKFEDWLELTARKRVFYLREQLSADEYRESMHAVQSAVGSGTFRWGGTAWQDAMRDTAGIIQMIVLLSQDAGQVLTTPQQVMGLLEDTEHPLPLREALKDIMEASPNFMSPPVRDRLTGEPTPDLVVEAKTS